MMSKAKGYILLLVLFFYFSCEIKSSSEESISKNSSSDMNELKDVSSDHIKPTSTHLEDLRDSLRQKVLETKAIEFDTLLDYNYDNKDDYVIGYYGESGSGLKNRIIALKNTGNSYENDSSISSIPNPTFDLNKNRITGFYIGNGGGWGQELIWDDSTWVTHAEFEVENNVIEYDDTVSWYVYFDNRTDTIIKRAPFQMVPIEGIFNQK